MHKKLDVLSLCLTIFQRNRSTSLESLLETDVSKLPLRDCEHHFTELSEALWQADRAGKKSELTERARERISKFLQERIDADAEAQLRRAIAEKKERLLAAALEVCGANAYITELVQECRNLQRHIAESGAGIRAAIQKCDRTLLEKAIARSDNIGFNDGDTVMARAILHRIERLDEEAAKVHTKTGCIEERVQTILHAARIIGYAGAPIKKLEALVADPFQFYTAQYNSAVARQDCDYAISVSIRLKDIFVQRQSDELQQLENCSLLRGLIGNVGALITCACLLYSMDAFNSEAKILKCLTHATLYTAPKEWAADTLVGRKSRASMFLHRQSAPHAPLTTRCASSDAKAGKEADAKADKEVYEVVRHNHRTVMKYLGQIKTKRMDEHLRTLWRTCRGRPELQDELFLVIMKQCRGDSNTKTIARAFKLLGLLFQASRCRVLYRSRGIVSQECVYMFGMCVYVNARALSNTIAF